MIFLGERSCKSFKKLVLTITTVLTILLLILPFIYMKTIIIAIFAVYALKLKIKKFRVVLNINNKLLLSLIDYNTLLY